MGLYAKPTEGPELLSFLSGGGGEKRLFVVLQSIFGRDFLSPRTTLSRVSKTIPAPAHLVVLMICHCCYHA